MSENPDVPADRPRPRPPARTAPSAAAPAPVEAPGLPAAHEAPPAAPAASEAVPDADDAEAGAPDGIDPDAGERERRSRRRILWQGAALLVVVAVVAVVLVVRHGSSSPAGGGSGTSVDQTAATLTDQPVANAFVAGATSDIAAVTSYDYRSLDSALYAGSAVATGDFLRSFRAALNGSLGAQARRLHRVQSFDQAAAAIGRISSDHTTASVLVFGTQTVTDDSTGQKPRSTPVTLVAAVQRSGDRYRISKLDSGGNPGLPPGTRALQLAAEAARETVADVLTLRHDHIAADIATVLGSTTNPLRTQLDAQTAKTRSAVTKGGYDLAGTVTAVAVQQATGTSATLLVAATGTRTDPGKAPRVVTDGRYQATVTLVGNRWLTTTLTSVQVG